MSPKQSREFVYLILAGIFITNALLAEIIGGKLFQLGPFTMSLGVIAWPVVFLTSDLVNEYFGKTGVRNLSLFTAGLILYMFIVIYIGMWIPAVSFSPVSDSQFNTVFGQSLWITAGSLVAFLLSQGVDVFVFWLVRHHTKGKMLWLRSTGSTVISQVIDTWVVLGIAFYLPGVFKLVPASQALNFSQYMGLAVSNYTVKLVLAIVLTPLIYVGHNMIERMLGDHESQHLIDQAAKDSLRDLHMDGPT